MNITTQEYNGTLIQFNDKMMNLTNMWKAWQKDETDAGVIRACRPVEYLRSAAGTKFVDSLAKKLKVVNSHLLKSTSGRYGGTYAHWQIALAYAKYLSPEFHIWCNEVVRDRFIERENPARRQRNHIGMESGRGLRVWEGIV